MHATLNDRALNFQSLLEQLNSRKIICNPLTFEPQKGVVSIVLHIDIVYKLLSDLFEVSFSC